MPATTDDIARARGCRAYDTALPADWADEVRQATGTWPAGLFVWCYDPPHGLFGRPVPLTPEADRLLARLEAARGR